MSGVSTTAKVLAGICGVLLLGLLITLHLYGGLKDNYQLLSEKHSRLTTVNNITIAAVAVNHRVSLDNINTKQVEGTEHVKVKAAIKTVLKDNHCASALVSAGVVSRLQQYERDIRARAKGSASATPDR